MSFAVTLSLATQNFIHRGTAAPPSGDGRRRNNDIQTSQQQRTSKLSQWWLLSVPSFLIAAYAANFLLNIYRVGDPLVVARIRSSLFGVSHIVGGLTAVLLGPFQFLASVRQHNPQIHRWIGRVYMAGILMSGLNAIHVSFTSLCRPLGQYAFATLGLTWLATAAMGMSTIWCGQVAQHRNWMVRNFSLTYAAVMLRWQLPLFIFLGLELEPALTLTGFTSWIPNLVVAEWWIKRHNF